MDFNRRSLLKSSLALGAAGLAVGQVHAAESQNWDETVDVVVIGSGFAGLAAAIEAKKAGANVVVLEKMMMPGGNSIINGGIMSAPGCPQQLKHGIKDSPELLAADMLAAGLHLNYPEKVKFVAEHALENFNWCVNELGVEFNPEAIGQEGGHSVPRYVFTKNGSGSGIVTKELAYLEKLGVKPRCRVLVEKIIRSADGRVEGVQVRDGYRFPKKDSGKVKTIRAKKGVVLCYGGFSSDVQYRTKLNPTLTDKFGATNQPGATSEMWREASRIGCLQVQNDLIQCTPWNNPNEKGMGLCWTFSQSGAAEFGIWVNTAGNRFVNELADRKVRSDAIILEEGKGLKAVAVCNEANLKAYKVARPGTLERLLKEGNVKKFDTVEALAAEFKIDAAQLKKTMGVWNESLKSGKDQQLGRIINKEQVALVDGPWYASYMSPKVHHCMGGLATDIDCRVLDVTTDQPIPGLFAAGEAAGGVHGACRLGSCAILDTLICGRVAGQKVAA